VFEGATSGLLGQDDIEEAGKAIGVGSAAAILMDENRWAAPSPEPCGTRLVAAGRIPVPEVIAALDSAEAAADTRP
jgi:hypothetical protein